MIPALRRGDAAEGFDSAPWREDQDGDEQADDDEQHKAAGTNTSSAGTTPPLHAASANV
jgi:hypothetical protein